MASAWVFRGLGVFGVFAASTACAPAPLVASPRAPWGSPDSAKRFPDSPAQRLRSRTLDFPLELRLPDKASWRISEGPAWLEAAHEPSASKLALRTWRAERLVRLADCAAQARLARPSIPSPRDDAIIDQRRFSAPAGFDTELTVGVEPSAHGVTGYALVFGASVGRCYAAVFTTLVAGSGAEQEVAARLGAAVDRILSGVRVRDIEQRAPRVRVVATPE